MVLVIAKATERASGLLFPAWPFTCLLSDTGACFLQAQAGPRTCSGGRKTKERTNTIQYLNKSSYSRQSENKLNVEKNRKEVRNMVPAFGFLKHWETGRAETINQGTKVGHFKKYHLNCRG